MFPTRRQLWQLVRDDCGVTSTEYATMLALIIIVCLSAAKTLGSMVQRNFWELGVRLR